MCTSQGDGSGDAATLLIRPNTLAQEDAFAGPSHRRITDSQSTDRARSDSNPLLDKYPVLKFHNVNVKDTSPVPDRKSKSLDFNELDQLIKGLEES